MDQATLTEKEITGQIADKIADLIAAELAFMQEENRPFPLAILAALLINIIAWIESGPGHRPLALCAVELAARCCLNEVKALQEARG